MEKQIHLRLVDLKYGEIEIPFLGLSELDAFTIRFKDKKELVDAISRMLELPVTNESVVAIVIPYQTIVGNRTISKSLPIKYMGDNFDVQSFQIAFKNYLLANPNRVRKYAVSMIKTPAMVDYMSGRGGLTDFDISTAVDLYFETLSYRKCRELYFRTKNYISVRKNPVVRSGKNVGSDLARLDSEDDYISSLLRHVLKGEEECQEALEELSLMDLDDLRSRISNSHYGVFDGMNTDNNQYVSDIESLEKYSGFSLEELIRIVSVDLKKRSKK